MRSGRARPWSIVYQCGNARPDPLVAIGKRVTFRVFDGSTHRAVTDPKIRSNRLHGVGTCQRCMRHTAVINFVLAQGDEDAAAFPGRNVSAGRQYFAQRLAHADKPEGQCLYAEEARNHCKRLD
jgi:hypothetical protein